MISPPYLAASGLVWGVAGLVLAWGLWRGYTLAWRFTLIFAGAYTLYYWIDRLWVSNSGIPANLPFSAGLNHHPNIGNCLDPQPARSTIFLWSDA